MIAAQKSHPPVIDGSTLWLCAALAVAAHAALLFAWKYAPEKNAAAIIEGDSVEVALVESAPAAAAAISEPAPPAAKPELVSEPATVPLPEPPKKEPEITLPEPPKPKPTPRPASNATPSPRAAQKPASTAKIPAAKNPAPSAGSTGGASSSTGTTTTGSGKSAKAGWLVRPAAAYPPESRAAGEHGVVILRIVVDGSGRPTSVSVAKSSGHPRLDRAAIEAGWRSRVRDAAPGSHLDAPVRFSLQQ